MANGDGRSCIMTWIFTCILENYWNAIAIPIMSVAWFDPLQLASVLML